MRSDDCYNPAMYLDKEEGQALLARLPHLRGSTVPTFFCDFDGVINALPYERVWVGGDKGDGQMYSPELYNPDNWNIVVRQTDPALHFMWDEVVEVENSGQTFTLRFSTELVSNIMSLIHSGQINLVWLTSWNEEAVNTLNPLLGLPDDTPYLPWSQRRSDYSHRGKYTALRTLVNAIPRDKRSPFVWVDDVATSSFINNAKKYQRSEHNFKRSEGVSSLILQTDPLYGISRKEWARIDTFVRKNQPVV